MRCRFLGRIIRPCQYKYILLPVTRIKILLHFGPDLRYEHLYLSDITRANTFITFSDVLLFLLRIDEDNFRQRPVLSPLGSVEFMRTAFVIDLGRASAHELTEDLVNKRQNLRRTSEVTVKAHQSALGRIFRIQFRLTYKHSRIGISELIDALLNISYAEDIIICDLLHDGILQ